MKRVKKKLFVCAFLAICLSILAYGTTAYFTYEETATNVITAGNVRIALDEKMLDESGDLVPFPKEGVSDVMPGQAVSKIVTVQNVGGGTAWIRVKLESAFCAADGSALPTEIGEESTPVLGYTVENGWTKGDDGYYYYETPVASGEITEILIDEVVITPLIGNKYEGGRANLIVSAEAVQTQNNGSTVFEAAGWPEKDMEGDDAQ